MVSHEKLLPGRSTSTSSKSDASSPAISPALSLDSPVSQDLDSSDSEASGFSSFIYTEKIYTTLSPSLSISRYSQQHSPSETIIEEEILEEDRKDKLKKVSSHRSSRNRPVVSFKELPRMSAMTHQDSDSLLDPPIRGENGSSQKISRESSQLSTYPSLEYADNTTPQCEECLLAARSNLPSSPSRFLRDAFSNSSRRRSRNRLFSSSSSSNSSGFRVRLASLNKSLECSSMEDSSLSGSNSTEYRDLLAAKPNYRIMVLGAKKTGKTSIIQQFLYDKFSSNYRETIDDMYRGEFDIHGKTIGFDIQDVSGGYVYDFPGMRNVSFTSADAFVLVFSLDSAESWQEISNLRDMIQAEKGVDIPIVIVGNKCDLKDSFDPDIPHQSVEAISVFDWENGYVESSAKDRFNINKIFKELLQQSKTKYYFDTIPASSPHNHQTASNHGNNFFNSPSSLVGHPVDGDCLKRRQSLPAVCPAHTITKPDDSSHDVLTNGKPQSWKKKNPSRKTSIISENKFFCDHKDSRRKNSTSLGSPAPDVRRFSIAAPRKDSCKVS